MSAASPGASPDDTGARSTGPGHLLRAARESAGIGVREVSAQLRLDERTVTALESDDFKDLPAPTFVRGYLRGYARLLGVPVGPVMEAYDREGFTPPDLVADIAETPDASTRDFPVRLASVGVVGALVLLVVLWWNNQAFNELPVPVAPPENTPEVVAPLSSGPRTATGADDASAALQGTPGARDESAGEPPPPPASTASAAATPEPPPRAAAEPSGVASTTTTATPPSPPAVAATAGEASADRAIARAEGVLERTRNEVNAIVGSDGSGAAAPAETPAGAATATDRPAGDAAPAATPAPAGGESRAGGPARLVMSFPIEAWVEVYDRSEERLFYNLAKPGQVVDVTGEPPIRILLGRTRGVSVSFNGENVDLAPFTERGVARLTLGQ